MLAGCAALFVTRTPFGRILRASYHREHRKHYIKYDHFRACVKRCPRLKAAASGRQLRAAEVAASDAWDQDFTMKLKGEWERCIEYLGSKVSMYEEHVRIVTSQHISAAQEEQFMFDKAEISAFKRVYV